MMNNNKYNYFNTKGHFRHAFYMKNNLPGAVQSAQTGGGRMLPLDIVIFFWSPRLVFESVVKNW